MDKHHRKKLGSSPDLVQNLITGISIVIAAIIVVGAMVYTKNNVQTPSKGPSGTAKQEAAPTTSAVREENGIQIAHVFARGGYAPRKITLAADKPAKLEVETKGTYDCSTAFTIPALDYRKQLPPTGITTIDIPQQKPGTKFTGLCSMGMYSFEIEFQ
jgi:heme/copper-type cytochrome/quinol oxidase subunit 2